MEVYVVKALWRNDEDFDCEYHIFDTEVKARQYYLETLETFIEDYNIDIKDVYMSESNDYLPYFRREPCYAEYCTGDYDYFCISVTREEVK